MQVKDIMTRDVHVLPPDTSVAEAAAEMQRHDCGVLPICVRERVVGIVTDRDIAIRATATGRDPKTTPVSAIMSDDELVYCYADEDVQEVARVMSDCHVRRVPVLDQNKRLVGILSLCDLIASSRHPVIVEAVIEAVANNHH